MMMPGTVCTVMRLRYRARPSSISTLGRVRPDGDSLRSSALGYDPPPRGPADREPPRDLRVAHLLGFEAEPLPALQRRRRRASGAPTPPPRLPDPRAEPPPAAPALA